MTDWRAVHVGFERDGLRLDGVSVWDKRWREVTREPLTLPHPAYPQQRHSFWIYEVGDPAHPVRFATGELSNGVWGFYLPD